VERGEKAVLGVGGVLEEAEGLVAVAGEDDFLERVGRAGAGRDGDAAGGADDGGGRGIETNPVGEWGGDFGNVGGGAAVDRSTTLVLGAEAGEPWLWKKRRRRRRGS